MPRVLTFSGYLLSVLDNNRICVRLDRGSVQLVSDAFACAMGSNVVKDTVVVNVARARVDISFDWSELQDLVGVHLRLVATPRTYNFWSTRMIRTGDGAEREHAMNHHGVSLIASNIKNLTAADTL